MTLDNDSCDKNSVSSARIHRRDVDGARLLLVTPALPNFTIFPTYIGLPRFSIPYPGETFWVLRNMRQSYLRMDVGVSDALVQQLSHRSLELGANLLGFVRHV